MCALSLTSVLNVYKIKFLMVKIETKMTTLSDQKTITLVDFDNAIASFAMEGITPDPRYIAVRDKIAQGESVILNDLVKVRDEILQSIKLPGLKP